MAHQYYSPSTPGQPGLHVVQDQPDLEVASPHHGRYDQCLPEARDGGYMLNDKEVITSAYASSADPEHHPLPPPHPFSTAAGSGKKRLWVIIGAVIAVLVILGAVLGGVLGSRAADSSSANLSEKSGSLGNADPPATDSTSDGTSPDNTTTSTLIRQGSGLAVTGWRKSDGSAETYLFFQDKKDGLQYIRCDKGHRSADKNATCWTLPVSVNSYAKPGSRLTATTIIWGTFFEPMIELFYTGAESLLLGVSFRPQKVPKEDGIGSLEIHTGSGSSLGAHWPWLLYQDGAGVLHHVRNNLQGEQLRPDAGFGEKELDIAPQKFSRLAVVPTAADFKTHAVEAGYAVFYQDTNSKLAVSIPNLQSSNRSKSFQQPWPTALPDITLPKEASIAAFSVARSGDAKNRVDTYVLHLGADGDIGVLYTDSSAGADGDGKWKTAAPAALKGADKDSDIACLTMASSPSNEAEQPVPLEEAGDEMRCFFQRGGRLVEVRLDGGKGEWIAVGDVPIP